MAFHASEMGVSRYRRAHTRGWLFKGLTARDYPTIPFASTSFSPTDISTNTFRGWCIFTPLGRTVKNESVIYETLLDEEISLMGCLNVSISTLNTRSSRLVQSSFYFRSWYERFRVVIRSYLNQSMLFSIYHRANFAGNASALRRFHFSFNKLTAYSFSLPVFFLGSVANA